MNKVVLVTGAARGIGYELTKKFLLNNDIVFMVDKDDISIRKAYENIKKEFEAYYPYMNLRSYLYYYRCDVRYIKDIQMIKEYISDIGQLDILVNNAGIGCNLEVSDTSKRQWDELIDVNLIGPIQIFDEFFAMLKETKGHIVNVSSGQVFFRLPGWGAYTTTKVALGAMSELMSFELEKHNIKVHTIYPFMVDTPFYENIKGDTFMSKMAMKLLPYYSNTAEEVADKIIKAVKNNKRIEYVNPINFVGIALRALPPVANLFTKLATKFLIKGKQ